MKYAVFSIIFACLAAPAAADGFEPVKEEATFVSLIDGKTLRNRLYGVQLTVAPEGRINGSAWGSEITGEWSWQDGYFCRVMAWGGDPIPYNCQLVELRGADVLRFTVDQGAGRSASFRLQ